MKLYPQKARKIIGDAKKTAAAVDLIYTTEDDLSILRKPHGRGFMYFEENQKITDKQRIKRFKNLVIPPAWKEVKICENPKGHLQAIGKDSKERLQYKYHPLWSKVRNSTKFFRMVAFAKALGPIRKQVKKDLKQKQMTQTKCLALVIRLMEQTHIRIGNNYYAKENQSYGLSTMRDKHVKDGKDEFRFEFTGKKGVRQTVKLTDKKLQKLVIQCEEIPGWELFQYYDEAGNRQRIESGMVNDYIQAISNQEFTAKDFRTWAASKIFLKKIIEFKEVDAKKEKEKNIMEACSLSAEKLGNTRSVCKNYYIHPALIKGYLSGELKKYKSVSNKTNSYLDSVEKMLLKIIENYSFEIET